MGLEKEKREGKEEREEKENKKGEAICFRRKKGMKSQFV